MHGMGHYPQNNSMGNYGPQGGQFGPQGETSGRRCTWCFCFVFYLTTIKTSAVGGEDWSSGVFCSVTLFFSNPKNIMNEFPAVVLRPSLLRR